MGSISINDPFAIMDTDVIGTVLQSGNAIAVIRSVAVINTVAV